MLNPKIKKFFSRDYVFYIIMLGLLLALFLPMFSFPPHSDHWTLLSFYHNLNDLPALSRGMQWLHSMNWDPNEQTNFRPLFGLYYYILYNIFGSAFVFVNLINFILYFLSAVILYKFGSYFIKSKFLLKLAIAIFILLFSHVDILLWSFHMHIIIGFSAFLMGFILYMEFLNRDRFFLIVLTTLFFLIGMLSYETFILWPFAILFLSQINRLKNKVFLKEKLIRLNFIFLVCTYFLYTTVFYLTRLLNTYGNPPREIVDFLRFKSLISAAFMVVFNLGYNIVVNLMPFVSFPLKMTENIYYGGPIVKAISNGYSEIVYFGGGFIGIFLFAMVVYLYKRKFFLELTTMTFLIFLIITETYVVFLPRVVINLFEYSLTEFRYQYIPNAFIILLSFFIIERFFSYLIKKRWIVLILIILGLNIYSTQVVLGSYIQQFNNVNRMLNNIKFGINSGLIGEDNKIYIDADMPEYLPTLCWNIWMGERFIKEGNYNLMFSEDKQNLFTSDPNNATWFIEKENFTLTKEYYSQSFLKSSEIDIGKDMQYVELANLYFSHKQFDKALAKIKKALRINPNNCYAYHTLGLYYLEHGKSIEAKKMFERAVQLNSRYAQPYADLGHFYNRIREYARAEELFFEALKIDGTTDGAYEGLANSYLGRGDYIKAESLLKKSLKLRPECAWLYADLGHFYNKIREPIKAREMFKIAIDMDNKLDTAYEGLGTSYMQEERFDEAESIYKLIIDRSPEFEQAYVDLGHLYNMLSRHVEAEALFKKAIELNSNQRNAYEGLVDCYEAEKRIDELNKIQERINEFDE